MLGPDTVVVNGQRTALMSWYSIAPSALGTPSNMVPVANVTVPPVMGNSYAQTQMSAANSNVGGYPASANAQAASNAARQPFSLVHSPVMWAVMFLVVGLVLLDVIFWRKGKVT